MSDDKTIKNDIVSLTDNPRAVSVDSSEILKKLMNNTVGKYKIMVGEDGLIFQADCIEFLSLLEDRCADVIMCDPPYNIKKTKWDYIPNYEEWITRILQTARMKLKETGTLYVFGFSENLADVCHVAKNLFSNVRWLVWSYDNKPNMFDNWGRSHESILVLRFDDYKFNTDFVRIPYNAHTLKYPKRGTGKTSTFRTKNENWMSKTWMPNPLGAKPKDVINIPVLSNGMKEKTIHPTQKPEELIRKLILAASDEGDLIVDPFSGSGTTGVCSRQLRRYFVLNDNKEEFNTIATERISKVDITKKTDYWIELDRSNAALRKNNFGGGQ